MALVSTFVLRIVTLINILLAIFQIIPHGDKSNLIDLTMSLLYTGNIYLFLNKLQIILNFILASATYALIGVNSYYHLIYGDYENN